MHKYFSLDNACSEKEHFSKSKHQETLSGEEYVMSVVKYESCIPEAKWKLLGFVFVCNLTHVTYIIT